MATLGVKNSQQFQNVHQSPFIGNLIRARQTDIFNLKTLTMYEWWHNNQGPACDNLSAKSVWAPPEKVG